MSDNLPLELDPGHIARIHGEQVTELPQDLYIPPDALQVFLEAFEGPLDLLLYLIKKQNFNILDIPIADITRQYVQYIELMHELQLELAAEYLVMAAMLAEIKSRLLLPRQATAIDDEDDPRAELVRRLQEYERFQKAAEDLDQLARVERDVFVVNVEPPAMELSQLAPQVELPDLLKALRAVLQRASMFSHHQVLVEALSVRERMTVLLSRVKADRFSEFADLFDVSEGRMGVVVTLLAILELVRQATIEFTQANAFATIYVRAKG